MCMLSMNPIRVCARKRGAPDRRPLPRPHLRGCEGVLPLKMMLTRRCPGFKRMPLAETMHSYNKRRPMRLAAPGSIQMALQAEPYLAGDKRY